MVILHADCSDHPCCLCFLGLLLDLVLGLGLVLGVTLVPTVDDFLLCKECQCPVLERKGLSVALNIERDLGSAGVDNGSDSVQEWSSQNDRQPLISACVHYHKVCRYVRVTYSHADLFQDSHGVAE